MNLIGVAFLLPLAGILAGIYLAAVLARRR